MDNDVAVKLFIDSKLFFLISSTVTFSKSLFIITLVILLG